MKPIPVSAKICVAICGVCLFLLAALWPKAEPEFNGKGLFAWIEDLEWLTSNLDTESKRARHESSANAIRQMGPSVVPVLLSRLRNENSKLERLREHWKTTVSKKGGTIREDNARIFAAIEIVGKNARGSIPEMMRLLETGEIPALAIVLSETFGEEALPYLLKGITNSAPQTRRASVVGIRMLGKKGKDATGMMITALGDKDPEVRVEAAVALGRLRGEARDVVPALINALNDTDTDVQEQAIISLGRYGSEAAAAIGSLEALARKSDQLGVHVSEALMLINK